MVLVLLYGRKSPMPPVLHRRPCTTGVPAPAARNHAERTDLSRFPSTTRAPTAAPANNMPRFRPRPPAGLRLAQPPLPIPRSHAPASAEIPVATHSAAPVILPS